MSREIFILHLYTICTTCDCVKVLFIVNNVAHSNFFPYTKFTMSTKFLAELSSDYEKLFEKEIDMMLLFILEMS